MAFTGYDRLLLLLLLLFRASSEIAHNRHATTTTDNGVRVHTSTEYSMVEAYPVSTLASTFSSSAQKYERQTEMVRMRSDQFCRSGKKYLSMSNRVCAKPLSRCRANQNKCSAFESDWAISWYQPSRFSDIDMAAHE